MFASLMRGKTNKKLPRELPRMHLSVRCDAHVLSLSLFLHRSAYLSPCPSCLSLFFERIVALGACQPRALLRWCTPSLALHLILPLLVLHPFRLPTFLRLPHPTPLPFSLALSLSLLFSLSLPLPPSTNNPLHPTPLSRGASCMHLLRQCTAGCFGTQRRRNSNFWMLLILFLSERRERWCVCDAFRTR